MDAEVQVVAFVLAVRIWQRAQAEAFYWRGIGLLDYAKEAEDAGRLYDA